jgi:DNA-binding NarL/FixJ family response regulator
VIRLLLVDDHAIFREGMKRILDDYDEIRIVADAGRVADALVAARAAEWDLALIDLSLPDGSGLELLSDLRVMYPARPVIVLSVHAAESYPARALKLGASGYLTKDSSIAELHAAIRRVARGGKYLTPAISERLALGRARSPNVQDKLSNREWQIMLELGAGRTVSEIARQLTLSVKTVSTHRAKILAKLNLRTNAELIRYVVDQKLGEG